MNEEKKKAIEELEYASPLEISRLLQQIELYDEKSSQEVLDEVYEKFDSEEHLEDEVLKPVFMSDRKSTRLNSSHSGQSRMPSSA